MYDAVKMMIIITIMYDAMSMMMMIVTIMYDAMIMMMMIIIICVRCDHHLNDDHHHLCTMLSSS